VGSFMKSAAKALVDDGRPMKGRLSRVSKSLANSGIKWVCFRTFRVSSLIAKGFLSHAASVGSFGNIAIDSSILKTPTAPLRTPHPHDSTI